MGASLAVGCNVTYYPNKLMFTIWIFPGAMKKYLTAHKAPEEPVSQEASQSSAEPFHEEERKFIQFWKMTEVQLKTPLAWSAILPFYYLHDITTLPGPV